MKSDRKELIFLQAKLQQLLEPINMNNWQDMMEEWHALCNLRGSLRGKHAQAILVHIFSNSRVRKTLGMMQQLHDMDVSGAVPAEILAIFKAGCGAELRRDEYTLSTSIERELLNIERVQLTKTRFVSFIGSIVLAALIGLSNLMSLWTYHKWVKGHIVGE